VDSDYTLRVSRGSIGLARRFRQQGIQFSEAGRSWRGLTGIMDRLAGWDQIW
jgi:hypothetical protein